LSFRCLTLNLYAQVIMSKLMRNI